MADDIDEAPDDIPLGQQAAVLVENEELGDLYLDDTQYTRARECFDRVIERLPKA